MRRRNFLAALVAIIIAPKRASCVTTRSGVEVIGDASDFDRYLAAHTSREIARYQQEVTNIIASDRRLSRVDIQRILGNARIEG
jgi:hypothetical protein